MRNLLIAVIAVALFATSFGATWAIARGGDGDERRAEPASTSESAASPSDATLSDTAEMCTRANEIHASAPGGEENYEYLRDELLDLSRSSTREAQAAVGPYIKGISWMAMGPTQGQEWVDASNQLLDGRLHFIEACSAAGVSVT